MKKSIQSERYGKIVYNEFGPSQAEENLIFIHGLLGSGAIWLDSIQHISQQVKCYAIDLPGNGLSEYNHKLEYNLELYANVLEEFIIALKLVKYSFVGHSMGAQIALISCLSNKTKPQNLFLISPSGIEEFSTLEKSIILSGLGFVPSYLLLEPLHKQIIDLSKNEKYTIELNQNFRRLCFENIKSMLENNTGKQLKNIDIPVYIFYGLRDEFIPNKMIHPQQSIDFIMKKAAIQIPDCELFPFEEGGHFIQLQYPMEFSESIMKAIGLEQSQQIKTA